MRKNTYCEHCNIEHPPINGLLSNEIVRGSEIFEYRNLAFEIWTIEHPNSHFWAWAIPIGETEKHIDEIKGLGFHLMLFDEGYYMAGYIYREEHFINAEIPVNDAKETLREITDYILDSLLPSEMKKIEQLSQIIKVIGK